MTYGLKKTTKAGTTLVQIWDKSFVSPRFVGIGAYKAREWKTRAGAERAAKKFTGAEVFTITDTMNY